MSKPTPEHQEIRILLVDDESLVRAALQNLLASWPGFAVVGEAETKDEALGLIDPLRPDVILLTVAGSAEQDLEIVAELARASEHSRVLVLTADTSEEVSMQVVRLGARGVVLKKEAPGELRKAIERVHKGEIWLAWTSLTRLITEGVRSRQQPGSREGSRLGLLTNRQREVSILVSKGCRNKEIGERLFISEVTVRHHLTTIFNKLNVSNRFELIAHVYRHEGSQ